MAADCCAVCCIASVPNSTLNSHGGKSNFLFPGKHDFVIPLQVRQKFFPAFKKMNGFYTLSSTSTEAPSNADLTSIPVDIPSIKNFLEDLKSLGRVRIIVNTGVGVLESVTTLEKLFYHELPGRGEYANLMNKDENVDFHLRLGKVKCAKLGKGKSMSGDIPTYTVRILDKEDKAAVLFLVMWKPGTNGEYDPGQVEAFEALFAKHGDTVTFRG